MRPDYDIAVIGGGAAGTMAALRAALSHRRTLWLSGDLDARRRSRAQWVSEIENLPGLPGQRYPLSHQAVQVLEFVQGHAPLAPHLAHLKVSVQALRRDASHFELDYVVKRRRGPDTPGTARARYVILATGVMNLQPVVQGSIEHIFPFANANQALYCLLSDGHRVADQVTGVVGWNAGALELALTLHERYHPPAIILLTQNEALQASDEQLELLKSYAIRVETAPIAAYQGEARRGGLSGVVLEDGQQLELTRLFISLGFIVYNGLACALGARLAEDGRVLTDEHGASTVPGLFVVGDLRAGALRQVYSAWDAAVRAVECIDQSLRLESRAGARRPE